MKVNGKPVSVPGGWRDSSLLEFLRDYLGMTGAKFGCGIGMCGACTVHLDGEAVRACVLPVGSLEGRQVTTIEGLATDDGLHPVQQAWIDQCVPQCGYCQPGQIMSACALLEKHPQPTEDEVEAAMRGNICRCGTYPRIRQAIQHASLIAREGRS